MIVRFVLGGEASVLLAESFVWCFLQFSDEENCFSSDTLVVNVA